MNEMLLLFAKVLCLSIFFLVLGCVEKTTGTFLALLIASMELIIDLKF